MRGENGSAKVVLPEFRAALNVLIGDMTHEEFGEKVGLSDATVGFYAAGKRLPKADRVRQIAEACGVSADWLLGMSENKTTDENVKAVCAYTGLTEEAANLLHNSFDCREYNDLYRGNEYLEMLNKLITYPGFFDLLTRILALRDSCRDVEGYYSHLSCPDYIKDNWGEIIKNKNATGRDLEYGPVVVGNKFGNMIFDILKVGDHEEMLKGLPGKMNNIVSSITDIEEKE